MPLQVPPTPAADVANRHRPRAALIAGLDLGPSLVRVAATGADFVPRALAERFRKALLREVDAGPFDGLPDRVGLHGVRQQGEIRALRGAEIAALPAVDRLRAELTALVHGCSRDLPGLASWAPNDVSVQRYGPGHGISVHLDGRRYRQLVAVFTLTGAAPFGTCTDRGGTVGREWQAAAGSLVLLRGPGLDARPDGRPLHAVRGPARGRRVSLTLRSDVRAILEPQGDRP